MVIPGGLEMTTSRDVLEALARRRMGRGWTERVFAPLPGEGGWYLETYRSGLALPPGALPVHL